MPARARIPSVPRSSAGAAIPTAKRSSEASVPPASRRRSVSPHRYLHPPAPVIPGRVNASVQDWGTLPGKDNLTRGASPGSQASAFLVQNCLFKLGALEVTHSDAVQPPIWAKVVFLLQPAQGQRRSTYGTDVYDAQEVIRLNDVLTVRELRGELDNIAVRYTVDVAQCLTAKVQQRITVPCGVPTCFCYHFTDSELALKRLRLCMVQQMVRFLGQAEITGVENVGRPLPQALVDRDRYAYGFWSPKYIMIPPFLYEELDSEYAYDLAQWSYPRDAEVQYGGLLLPQDIRQAAFIWELTPLSMAMPREGEISVLLDCGGVLTHVDRHRGRAASITGDGGEDEAPIPGLLPGAVELVHAAGNLATQFFDPKSEMASS